jgi:hypothetical protein
MRPVAPLLHRDHPLRVGLEPGAVPLRVFDHPPHAEAARGGGRDREALLHGTPRAVAIGVDLAEERAEPDRTGEAGLELREAIADAKDLGVRPMA